MRAHKGAFDPGWLTEGIACWLDGCLIFSIEHQCTIKKGLSILMFAYGKLGSVLLTQGTAKVVYRRLTLMCAGFGVLLTSNKNHAESKNQDWSNHMCVLWQEPTQNDDQGIVKHQLRDQPNSPIKHQVRVSSKIAPVESMISPWSCFGFPVSHWILVIRWISDKKASPWELTKIYSVWCNKI